MEDKARDGSQGQGMLCSARLILQGLCNTLPAWSLASAMQLWAPEAQAGSWKHLQAAGIQTLWHMGCSDPKKQRLNPLQPFLCCCPCDYWKGEKQGTGWKCPWHV